ncbi:DNA replication/repair protein RecF [Dermabacteraceae bacterium P13115]|nr:DNA replication/repair protein RecF [Dermabacteraceae bacterium TAE3-ERU5]
MHLLALSLGQYRSYKTLQLAFEPGVTVFVGPNGQGKTNIVEAVWYLATLSSHRVAHDGALVHRGDDYALIRAAVQRSERRVEIDVQIAPGKSNRAKIQGAPQPRVRDVLGYVRAVLFAPEDLSLVKGDPESRRRFLDELLFTIAPRYAGVKADYDRVLKQRANLLKQLRGMSRGKGAKSIAGLDPEESAYATLDVWDMQLALKGAELLRARLHLVDRLRPHFRYAYLRVSSDAGADAALALSPDQREEPTDSPATIRYTAPGIEEVYRDKPLPATRELARAIHAELTARRQEEIERGQCLVGPHRDDLTIELSGFPAKGYASHGESWSLALALRLGAFDLLRLEEGDLGGGEPILILDDVFSELDVQRRERLGRIIADANQVLITTANDSDIPESLAQLSHKIIDVTKGSATPRPEREEKSW